MTSIEELIGLAKTATGSPMMNELGEELEQLQVKHAALARAAIKLSEDYDRVRGENLLLREALFMAGEQILKERA